MNLNDCRIELRTIIRELRDIEQGVRRDFRGVGEEMCAKCVGMIANNYQAVLKRLENVNQNRLASWMTGKK